MVSLGMMVIVASLGVLDEDGCYGIFYREQFVDEKSTITVIKDAVCPDGKLYDNIVGVDKKYLKPKP